MAGLRSIWKEDLWKIASLNSLSIGLKLVTGFITSKLLAVYIGPAGLALVGNLRNFLTSVENIATFGFTNGIVKYTASYQDQPERQQEFINSVLTFLPIMAL
ncbi:MAG: oligosaccharide flippase family protein, partial [Flavobacterium stagni]